MTWCEAAFLAFSNKIKLDAERLGRINGAIERLVQFCNNDPELSHAQNGDISLQGSVVTKTVVKPLNEDIEFDVDLVFPFALDRFNSGATASGVLEWLEGRLKGSEFYRNRLISKDRCARIDYAGDFHLDITPATQSILKHQPMAIPARDRGDWVTTDPQGFADWVREIDGRSMNVDGDGVGRFVRCVRFMKRWRDASYQSEPGPSSILLVTTLGKHDPSRSDYRPPISDPLFPQYQTDVAYLYDMLRLTHSCVRTSKRSAFSHPTLHEDLARDFTDAQVEVFLDRLEACFSNLRLGIYSDNDATSIGHFRDAFGGTFPAT